MTNTIGDEVERQSRGRGDSVSFEDRGVPALFFGDGESVDYHKPTDTIDKLTPAILETRARAIARVVVELANAPRQRSRRAMRLCRSDTICLRLEAVCENTEHEV